MEFFWEFPSLHGVGPTSKQATPWSPPKPRGIYYLSESAAKCPQQRWRLIGYQILSRESSACSSSINGVADLVRFAGQRGKRPTENILADLNRGPANDETGTETARGTVNGTRIATVTVIAAAPPIETASETGNAIKTETGTTTARGTETVNTGPSAVTAVSATTTATATATVTIDGTVTASEIANGIGTTGGRSGLARILTRVDQMRKDVKRTQWRMGLPADASLSLDLRGRITRGNLRGAGGTTMTPRTTAAEKRDRRGSLPRGEICPLTSPLGLLF